MNPADTLIRPFTQRDLAPGPEVNLPRPPDFVGVAAPKCGTSWWYRLLTEHPAVAPHRLYRPDVATSKELHYFHHFVYRGLTAADRDLYQQAFAAPPAQLCGEFTTRYMNHPGCLELLAETAPRTRILVMLRNPVDRTLSHVNHVWRHRRRRFRLEGDDATLFRLFSVDTEALFYSYYGDALERLIDLFGREQMLVLQYEACRDDPRREIRRSYAFLGLDPDFAPPSLERPVNRVGYGLDPASGQYRKYLENCFRADVERTLTLLPELDPALWPDFS